LQKLAHSLPIGRMERPLLVASSRTQEPSKSISAQRSPQASSQRIPVKAISRSAAAAIGFAAASIASSSALFYAGVTRGKRLVVLLGQRKVLAIAVNGTRARKRWSKPREWLVARQ
jgi:hypothetical protein